MEQDDGRGPDEGTLPAGQGNYLMKINIGAAPPSDPSVDPATNPSFYALPPNNLTPLVTRTFDFERTNGMWAVNNQFAGPCSAAPRFRIKRNTVEKWIFHNGSGGWAHPIHVPSRNLEC